MFLDSLLLLDSIVTKLDAEITTEISWINIGEQIPHINSHFGMFRLIVITTLFKASSGFNHYKILFWAFLYDG